MIGPYNNPFMNKQPFITKKYKGTLLLIGLSLFNFTPKATAQIVDIENQRLKTDTTGWAGTLGLSITASKNVTSYFTLRSNAHLQYKTNKNAWLGILDYALVKAGGNDFGNNGFIHLRYNQKLTKLVQLELFMQGQFNKLAKIKSRYLNGIGMRLKLSQYDRALFYYGLAYMYENEQLEEPILTNRDHRLSSYFSFTLLSEKQIKLSNTIYMQPKISEIEDYRLSNDSKLTFKVNRHLTFSTTFRYLFDAVPPEEVPKSNYQMRNGLTFNF